VDNSESQSRHFVADSETLFCAFSLFEWHLVLPSQNSIAVDHNTTIASVRSVIWSTISVTLATDLYIH